MKTKILIVIVLFFLSFSTKMLAQGEGNMWYFGNYAGLNFNSGSPVAVTNGKLSTNEGCAAISTPAGALQFYTDGITVWNKTHVAMPNGTGLLGDPSSTQSAIIIPKPGNPNIYYVFTVDAVTITMQGGPNGLRYSEVDMTLNGGLGDINANKNISLANSVTEKLTAVKKANNIDYWVIAHDFFTDKFLVYSVTSAGVNMLPITSNAGSVDGISGMGYLKASVDGSKLAQAIDYRDTVDVLNFNTTTGIVTSNFTFPAPFVGTTVGVYGVEFSPDGSRLYITSELTYAIYQYNLALASPTAIIASATVIGTGTSNFPGLGALQRGPDGKIYVARPATGNLGCIPNPNALGTSCGYINNGVSLSGWVCVIGLPNFLPTYSNTPEPCVITASFSISPSYTVHPNTELSFINGSTAGAGLSWNFGDPLSGSNNTSSLSSPKHTYTTEGSYCIRLIATNTVSCSDTIEKCITVVKEPIIPIEIVKDIEIPNIFTPNGDGKNDLFAIKNLQLGVAVIKIYDRWGTMVYESSGYNNDWTGKNVSDGVYYYILNYPIDNKTYTGFVQVL